MLFKFGPANIPNFLCKKLNKIRVQLFLIIFICVISFKFITENLKKKKTLKKTNK